MSYLSNKQEIDKVLKSVNLHGYTFNYFDNGLYFFSKRDEDFTSKTYGRYKSIVCSQEQLFNGDIEFMTEMDLSLDNSRQQKEKMMYKKFMSTKKESLKHLSTKKIVKQLLESAEYVEPNVKEQIDGIIQTLRDEDFYNEKARKKFIAHLTNLIVLEDDSDDARKSVRKFFKHISNAITEYEIDIADDSDIVVEENLNSIEENNNQERMRHIRMTSESKELKESESVEFTGRNSIPDIKDLVQNVSGVEVVVESNGKVKLVTKKNEYIIFKDDILFMDNGILKIKKPKVSGGSVTVIEERKEITPKQKLENVLNKVQKYLPEGKVPLDVLYRGYIITYNTAWRSWQIKYHPELGANDDFRTVDDAIDFIDGAGYNFDPKWMKESKLTEEQWSADVKTKENPPEGLFSSGSAEEIASWAKRSHDDLQSAMSSINFYLNRAGANLSSDDKNRIENAKDKLRKMYENKNLTESIGRIQNLYREAYGDEEAKRLYRIIKNLRDEIEGTDDAMFLAVSLLEDVNAHDESKAVNDVLLKFWDENGSLEESKNQKLTEAEEISYDELSETDQIFLDRNDIDPKNIKGIWSGIHGRIVNVAGPHSDSLRLDDKDLKKLALDPSFRWADITSIGFGKGF